jgi:hypothetical protein
LRTLVELVQIMLNLVQIISAVYGHLDSDLDHLIYGLNFIHRTYKFYKLELTNYSLVSLPILLRNHQNYNYDLTRLYPLENRKYIFPWVEQIDEDPTLCSLIMLCSS